MNLYLAVALGYGVSIAWLIWEVRRAPDIADYLGVSEMEAAELFDGVLHGDLDSNVAPGLMATLMQESTGGAPTAPAHARRDVRRASPGCGARARRRGPAGAPRQAVAPDHEHVSLGAEQKGCGRRTPRSVAVAGGRVAQGDADTKRTHQRERERTCATQAIPWKGRVCRQSAAARDRACPRLRLPVLSDKEEVPG